MKKISILFVLLGLVFAIVLIGNPKNVQAGYSASKQSIAAGNWNIGTETEVDLNTAPAPEWLQLMTTSAVVVNQPTKICHVLGGGSYHWIGEIRKLKDGKWIKLETTNGWSPDEEGTFVSCTQAPSAGTYALFAYYNGPQEVFIETEAPTLITPLTCGVHEVVVNGFCDCEAGFERKNGACSPKIVKLN